jgi:hypothetical protein
MYVRDDKDFFSGAWREARGAAPLRARKRFTMRSSSE